MLTEKIEIDAAKESTLQKALEQTEHRGLFTNVHPGVDLPESEWTPIGSLNKYGSLLKPGDNHYISVAYNDLIYYVGDNWAYMAAINPETNTVVYTGNTPYSIIDVHQTCMVVYNNEIHLLGGYGTDLRSH